ncbi:MAG: hypothetical protein ABW061_00570 [Polyangiaceae bacterium]
MQGWNAEKPVDALPAIVPEPDWSVRYTRLAGYGVYAVMVLASLMIGAVPGKGSELLGGLAIFWSMSYFCALDARARGFVFVQSFWRLSSMGWPFSVLFHLVRVRGKRGALTFALHGALLLFCAGTSAAIGSLLAK